MEPNDGKTQGETSDDGRKTSRRCLTCVCLLMALLLGHVEASAQVSGTMVSQTPFEVGSTGALCMALAANRGGPDYVRVESNLFTVQPESFGISIGRRGGVLVSETIAAVVSSVRSGRFYVEMSSRVTTGFAIANPGSQSAMVHVFVTSETGVRGFETTVKPIVETVDRRGLKKHFLQKHRKNVDWFYRFIDLSTFAPKPPQSLNSASRRSAKNCSLLIVLTENPMSDRNRELGYPRHPPGLAV